MDIAKILAKLNSLDYANFAELCADIQLLFDNSLTYYKVMKNV